MSEETTHQQGIIPGPVWSDGCNHKPEEYVCSFEIYKSNGQLEKIDLYVFMQARGQSVCLRFGERAEEYMSPGPIASFMRRVDAQESYLKAYELLNALGTVEWHPKNAESPANIEKEFFRKLFAKDQGDSEYTIPDLEPDPDWELIPAGTQLEKNDHVWWSKTDHQPISLSTEGNVVSKYTSPEQPFPHGFYRRLSDGARHRYRVLVHVKQQGVFPASVSHTEAMEFIAHELVIEDEAVKGYLYTTAKADAFLERIRAGTQGGALLEIEATLTGPNEKDLPDIQEGEGVGQAS